MTKLKIDLVARVVEVEGEEQFVRIVYEDYKSYLEAVAKFAQSGAGSTGQAASAGSDGSESSAVERRKPIESGRKKTKVSKETYDDGALNFSVDDVQHLRLFYKEKSPSSGFERNLVFVHFLQKEKNKSGITPNHIYTCYNLVEVKSPTALRQSIIDTSNKKKWLDTSNMDSITVTLNGEMFVRHDLPLQKKD